MLLLLLLLIEKATALVRVLPPAILVRRCWGVKGGRGGAYVAHVARQYHETRRERRDGGRLRAALARCGGLRRRAETRLHRPCRGALGQRQRGCRQHSNALCQGAGEDGAAVVCGHRRLRCGGGYDGGVGREGVHPGHTRRQRRLEVAGGGGRGRRAAVDEVHPDWAVAEQARPSGATAGERGR